MSKGFKDAVVLTQNSPGVRQLILCQTRANERISQHCSLAQPSMCTAKYVRQYFRDGTLPPEDTVCEVDSPIFKPDFQEDKVLEPLSAEDASLRESVKDLSEGLYIPLLGLPF